MTTNTDQGLPPLTVPSYLTALTREQMAGRVSIPGH